MNARAHTLHVEETTPSTRGASPPLVVMVHGSMDRSGSFARTARRLRHLHVLRYDRRGYAQSFGLGPPRCFQQQVDDLVSVLDGRPAVAVGHSFGGNVVLATAASHPRLIRAAVVWEPPMPWEPWWPQLTPAAAGAGAAGAAEAFMLRAVGARIWSHLPEATRRQRIREGTTLVAEMASLENGCPFDPAAVRCPVTLGYGTESAPYQRAGAERLAAALPSAAVAHVEGSAHGVHLSHPAELAALVDQALARAGENGMHKTSPLGDPAKDRGGFFPCV